MLYVDIFKTLNENKVRYLVVGGVAVNLHGIQRATADLDLIVALDSANLEKFVKAMNSLGYKPKVPVAAEDFCVPENRKKWMNEKGMKVFSFYNPKDPFALVDIFVYEPMPFEEMNRRKEKRAAFGVSIPIASIEDLIVLKKESGRPKDMYDLDALGEVLRLQHKRK